MDESHQQQPDKPDIQNTDGPLDKDSKNAEVAVVENRADQEETVQPSTVLEGNLPTNA